MKSELSPPEPLQSLHLPPTLSTDESLRQLAKQTRKALMRVWWLVAIALLVYEVYIATSDSWLTNLAAVLITLTALLPAYLWCGGRALGLPIMPVWGLTFLWTYALPLVSHHPKVIQYSPTQHLMGGLTVAGVLLLSTWVWYQYVKTVPPKPKFYWALNDLQGNAFFFTALATSILFNVANNAGWLVLSAGVFSMVRSVVLGLAALATFVLSYRMGKDELTRRQAQGFVVLLLLYMIAASSALLLNHAATLFLVATIAYIIGSKRIPLLIIILAFVCLSVLHYGKSDMRAKYWSGEVDRAVQPWHYPAYYSEWLGYSVDYLTQKQENPTQVEEKESFVERSSIIHMLMLAQARSPDVLPYLQGKTYEILPQVVVPRLLNNSRIRSQESTHMLSVYYGLQTFEATQKTSIAWGLIAEAYANFGAIGCAGLAIVLGAIYGMLTRQGIQAPTLSLQSLFAVLMFTFSVQTTEWTASTFVAAFSQSSLLLLGIALCFMSTYPTYYFPTIQRE